MYSFHILPSSPSSSNTKYILVRSMPSVGNSSTTLYKVKSTIQDITLSDILMPAPATSLSCLPCFNDSIS
jgi:hypothetical protein